ncbi:hypothetical protein D9C73_027531 [Collichthys lucidus]|uniref:Uncharacterized protein n=1 Tax=Collichthys lucidus TaxID=240159 RepID=A0A4U5TW52_COLLU|nr:hypothetical protein D9C73_027531 [Collichthys lucidus]
MLTNITLFIKHVKCSFQAASKVKSTDLDKIIYEIKTLQGNVHKHVVVHRQKVVKKKTDDGEVIYDDAPDSSSSLSSGEKSRFKRWNKRPHGFSEPDSESSDDESPEDEPPSFPDRRHKSKKKLDFSMQSKKPSVHSAFSPSKCFVLVDRMSKSMEKEYTFKGKAKYRKLAKGMEESLETPVGEAVQKGETLQTPDEETPLPPGGGGEDIPETTIEEGAGNLGILEIVLEQGGGENLETLVEDTPLPLGGREEEIPETLVEDMPAGEMVETPVEEAVGVGEILETLVEEGGGEEIILETPVEDMPEKVINSCPVEDSGNPI